MIIADTCFNDMVNAPVRKLRARVELYDSVSTLLDTFYYTDRLISFSIERVGEDSKFFGFGVCQKLNIHLLDPKRELNITTDNYLEVEFGAECNYVYTCPKFYVSRVNRDENTNELSITAYDGLYVATAHQVSELNLVAPYTIGDFARACASLLGFPITILGAEESFATSYTTGANFEGTESIREALDAIAEATQTIYYIDSQWTLTFRRLDIAGDAVYAITKDHYYTLDSGANRRLATVCHATELGNNVSASLVVSGTTQYVRDNPFWDMRIDIAELVDNALTAIGGLTINQFDCSWRGNFLLEIGDKVSLTTKDNAIVFSYILDDVITYNGALSQETRWNYVDNDVETATNPTSLGDAIKQTYAKVDKANKKIDLLVSETNENLTQLQLDTNGIQATVQQLQNSTTSALGALNEDVANITRRVEATMTAEDVKIEVQKEIDNGVSAVITKTGFTFDDEGLTVSKTGTEMTTQITEDGMKVFRDEEEVLIANNEGVVATNLHANTYLWIGKYSRLEDYEPERTGCFWVWDGEF